MCGQWTKDAGHYGLGDLQTSKVNVQCWMERMKRILCLICIYMNLQGILWRFYEDAIFSAVRSFKWTRNTTIDCAKSIAKLTFSYESLAGDRVRFFFICSSVVVVAAPNWWRQYSWASAIELLVLFVTFGMLLSALQNAYFPRTEMRKWIRIDGKAYLKKKSHLLLVLR